MLGLCQSILLLYVVVMLSFITACGSFDLSTPTDSTSFSSFTNGSIGELNIFYVTIQRVRHCTVISKYSPSDSSEHERSLIVPKNINMTFYVAEHGHIADDIEPKCNGDNSYPTSSK